MFCFPHAGGTAAAYRPWAHGAPWDIEVCAMQYPGRGDRYAHPAHRAMDDLVAELAADLLREQTARPQCATLLFGHSMGAAVAYETARSLSGADRPPAALFVSGQSAPHRSGSGELHRATDHALVQDLRRLGGTADGVLDDDALMDAMLPSLRRDYELIETYRPRHGHPLNLPVTVLHATADPEVTEDEARAWTETTDRPCELLTFPGGHFHLHEQHTAVLAAVVTRARNAIEGAAGRPWASMP
ncbi:thioesterase [Streptomyces sp. CB02923]|nr:thioesterase [Streptomyces sp. CB02923]